MLDGCAARISIRQTVALSESRDVANNRLPATEGLPVTQSNLSPSFRFLPPTEYRSPFRAAQPFTFQQSSVLISFRGPAGVFPDSFSSFSSLEIHTAVGFNARETVMPDPAGKKIIVLMRAEIKLQGLGNAVIRNPVSPLNRQNRHFLQRRLRPCKRHIYR